MGTDKVRMRDMVILLPGIMGSVLEKDNKDLFALSWSAAWTALTSAGSSLQEMMLKGDDPVAKDLGDGIRATRLMPDAHLIPGFFKIDGYERISRFITDYFNVIKGDVHDATKPANYFEFPYDWRRDNRASARRLEELIDARLPQWRESSGFADAKVILIGHSMGGLVSRYYLEALGGWEKCRALITFGTPYRGSLNALNFLSNGYKNRFVDLTNVMRSFTSSYQLLPVYKVMEVDGEFQRVAEMDGIPGIDRARAAEARNDFHEVIRKAVETHQNEVQYLKQGYKMIPIVGTRQPTLQSAKILNGVLVAGFDVPSKDAANLALAEGDGTVPRLSATPLELSDEYRETFFPERHASLQNNTNVLADLYERLKQMQVKISEFRGAPPSPAAAEKPALSLALEDLYFADEPIVMRARLINVNESGQVVPPKARIEPANQAGGAIVREFRPTGEGWEMECEPLPPGPYRVEVLTSEFADNAPPPVHDIFEVHQ